MTTFEYVVPKTEVESFHVDVEKSEARMGESRKRNPRSIVWEHFTKIANEDGQSCKCQCNHCGRIYSWSIKIGTSHVLRHLTSGACPEYKLDNATAAPILIYRKRAKDCENKLPPQRKCSKILSQLSPDVKLEHPSSKTVEDYGNEGVQNQTQPPLGAKPLQESASKSETKGEAWIDDLKSCVAKLVKLTNEVEILQASASVTGRDYSILAALKCLNEFEDVVRSSAMYLDAVEILRDAGERECFIGVRKELRRPWLQRLLHRRHPLRYSF